MSERRNPRRHKPDLKRTVGLAARRIAADCLAEIRIKRRPLEQVLAEPGGHPMLMALIAKDKALLRAILVAALRHGGEIDAILDRLVETPLPHRARRLKNVLAVAAAQILYLDVPDHAAVALAVETAAGDRDLMHYKGLANAVLRRLAADKAALLAEIDPGRVNTPDWLFTRWAGHYGEATALAIGRINAAEPALDLTAKSDPAGWAERLGGRLLPTGSIRLAVKDRVETLPGFADGAWWVQDAAAALPARLLGDVAGKRVADLCAAPGGKTAQLAAAGGIVTAVDIAPDRLARLEENLARLGLEARVVAADILDWRPDAPFEAVLLDAPCTATGTIRRHPDILHLKREDDIAALAALQRRLLLRAADLVGPGGTIVYSTCSLEPEEGEAVVAATLVERPDLHRDPIRPDEVPGLAEALNPAGELRTLPTQLADPDAARAGLDGFFVARLRRL